MKLLNCVLYLVLTALIGFLAGRIIPKKWLNPHAGIFCSFKFEQDGKLYEKLGIRKWQKRVPDMSRIFPSLMPPKNLSGHYEARLPLMIEETCMAEATHIVMSFVGIGCLWICPGFGGILLTLIDILLFNLPFILIQRYNRPRLIRLHQKYLHKQKEE